MKLSSTCELNEDPFTHTEEDITATPFDGEDVNIED